MKKKLLKGVQENIDYNIQAYIILGFFSEVIFFLLSGIAIATKSYFVGIVDYILAVFFAIVTGKLIEKNAIEKYKRGEIK